jgi:hypothetical protein
VDSPARAGRQGAQLAQLSFRLIHPFAVIARLDRAIQ